jgi:hypothetical protein
MKVPAMFLLKLCLAVYTIPHMSASSPTLLGSFFHIIQWIDWTSVAENDRFSLKPYMCTPAILRKPFVEHSKLGDIMVFFQSIRTPPHNTKARNLVSTFAISTLNFVLSWKRSVLPTIAFVTSLFHLVLTRV